MNEIFYFGAGSFGIFIIGFGTGYFAGRLNTILTIFKDKETQSFVAAVAKDQKEQALAAKKKVEIDDRKFVTDLSTDDMKTVDRQNLGIVVKTTDNIADATLKLAQLKKKKE